MSPLLHNNIIIYIDDILVMSESFEEHVELVSKVLSLLANYQIKVKVSKCDWFKDEVRFLGHIINRKGIRKSPEFVDKVMKVEKPRTVKQLRKFVGLINFQRKFIKNCSLLTRPLTECISGKGSQKISWTPEMEQVFLKLKEAVCEDVMLTYPDYSKGANKMELYVDASGTGCGSCLMQKQQGEPKVIAYNSMTFSNTQRRYSATDREMTAIRWGVNNFRCFLIGAPFVLVTDHKPLTYLSTMSSTNSRLMRTVEELAEFDFEIIYRPGKDNEAADFLSRSNDLDKEDNEEINDFKYLPPGLMKICEVPGGGNSMFESLLIVMKEGKDFYGYDGIVPEDHILLRETLVAEVGRNWKEYGLSNGKQLRQRLKLMSKDGQQPMAEILLAASKLYNIKIYVYCGMKSPVVFVYEDSEDTFAVRMQCVSMMHYNPLCVKGRLIEEIKDGCVNRVQVDNVEKDLTGGHEVDLGEIEIESVIEELECQHTVYHASVQVSGTENDVSFCGLLDTGAQVSLVNDSVVDKLREEGCKLEIHNINGELISITQTRHKVKGYVNLSVLIKGVECVEWPFVIIEDENMPICFLLGADFIEGNDIELDLGYNKIIFKGKGEGEKFVVNSAFTEDESYRFSLQVCFGISLDETKSDDQSSTEDEGEEEECLVPKYMVSNDELVHMQKHDYTINQLRRKINQRIPTSKWHLKSLKQFKRSAKQIRFEEGLLVKGDNNRTPVVVSMRYMIDIVSKTHESQSCWST